MDLDVALTILIGILPLAAVLGAIITKVMMKRFRRLSGIYIFTIVNCVAVGLINVNMFPTLLVGRFLEGICIGFYSAIAPIYLREIAPKELRKLLGLFFSLGKVVGILTVIIV
jgi:MFS family permease